MHRLPTRVPLLAVTLLLMAFVAAGCQTTPPLAAVKRVDLGRFMGDWYVLANIPTFIEKGAHNARESYRLAADGTIDTTFSFRAGGFDGEPRRYTLRGFVLDRDSNAVWGMQFIWPIKADYRIAWLAPDYSVTLIAREKRDHLWIMARTPTITEAEYRALVDFAAVLGYDTTRIRRVPQRWPERPEAPQ